MVRGTFATTVPYSKHANVTITGEQLDGRLGVHSLQAMLRKEEARRGPPGPRGARGASQGGKGDKARGPGRRTLGRGRNPGSQLISRTLLNLACAVVAMSQQNMLACAQQQQHDVSVTDVAAAAWFEQLQGLGIYTTTVFPSSFASKPPSHVPVIASNGTDGAVSISVGSVVHEMTETHHIDAVWLRDQDGELLFYQAVSVPDTPVIYEIAVPNGTVSLTAFEHCNLHGTWQSETYFVVLAGGNVVLAGGNAPRLTELPQGDVTEDLHFGWHFNPTTNLVEIQLTLDDTVGFLVGFLAVGVSVDGSMVATLPSKAVVGQAASVQKYTLIGQDPMGGRMGSVASVLEIQQTNTVLDEVQDLVDTSFEQEDGTTRLGFHTTINWLEQFSAEGRAVHFIWAYSRAAGDPLGYHGPVNRGTFVVAHLRTQNTAATDITLITACAESQFRGASENVYYLHGFWMSMTWSTTNLVGIFIARYCRHHSWWITWHIGFMSFGVAGTAGMVAVAASMVRNQMNSTHHVVGSCVGLLSLVQSSLGTWVHNYSPEERHCLEKKHVWVATFIHKLLGKVLVGMALSNVWLGYELLPIGSSIKVVWSLWVLMTAVAFMVAEVRMWSASPDAVETGEKEVAEMSEKENNFANPLDAAS